MQHYVNKTSSVWFRLAKCSRYFFMGIYIYGIIRKAINYSIESQKMHVINSEVAGTTKLYVNDHFI